MTDLIDALNRSGDAEHVAEQVNNTWQFLWRVKGIDLPAALLQELDSRMQDWVTWKAQFDEAILRRAVPFEPFSQRDWYAELRQIQVVQRDFFQRMVAASRGRVAVELKRFGRDANNLSPPLADPFGTFATVLTYTAVGVAGLGLLFMGAALYSRART
jgi:hypothetical protein